MLDRPYTGKARDYARHRPQYASAAIEELFRRAGLNADSVVADIASGTGNVTRHLVGRVARVYAVEPDDGMRREAERLLAQHAGFSSVGATAEATSLPDSSVDAITVGQALHWFDARQAHAEFCRILRPGGHVAFIWNRFGHLEEPDLSAFLARSETARLSFPGTLQEDWAQFIGGARSAARTPNAGAPGYGEFERRQRAVFDARATDGVIVVRFATELATGPMSR